MQQNSLIIFQTGNSHYIEIMYLVETSEDIIALSRGSAVF